MEGDQELVAATACAEPTTPLRPMPDGSARELPPILDLTLAKSLRDNLMALLKAGQIVLDASGVERLSTPCAQVLMAAGISAASTHSPFRIVNASAVFRTALTDLGLQTAFSKWMD